MKAVFTVLLLGVCFFTNAKEPEDKKMVYGAWAVHGTPTQFVLKEIPIGVEKYIGNRHTVGISFAYKFGRDISGDTLHPMAIEHFYLSGRYHARTIGLNSKWYFDRVRMSYIDVQVFNRRWWYDKVSYWFNNFDGTVEPRTSLESMEVWGMKLLVGGTLVIPEAMHLKLYVNGYAGLGMRFRSFHGELFQSTVRGIYHDHEIYNAEDYKPSIQLGLNFGVMYYPRKMKTYMF